VILSVNNIEVIYDHVILVLRGVSLRVPEGGIVALLGWLGYLAIRAFTREPTRPGRAVSDLLEHQFGLDEPRRRPLARWLASGSARELLGLPE